jgi:HlyD family secretion protein
MNRKYLVVGAILVLAITASGYAWHAYHGRDKPLSLSGNVDIREVNLSFRVAGRLKALAVDEGAHIHAGDLLGELDAEPYRIALDDAQSANAALQAHKALYREGYRQEDIEQARANLDARVATQVNAEQVYQRQVKLADTGASAQKALDDARGQRDQAVALTAAARQQFQELSRGYRKHEVEEVDANAARAAAQLEQARLQLADTRLTAPADGTILTRAVEPGSMLAAGSTVLTLSLDRPVWVRTYVGESDLGKVAPGRRVKVYTDARVQPYNAVIGFVSPTSEFTPKNVETQDLRTALMYRLRVIVEDPDAALRQGMPVTVKLDGGN